jgi:hypothetical protein
MKQIKELSLRDNSYDILTQLVHQATTEASKGNISLLDAVVEAMQVVEQQNGGLFTKEVKDEQS